MPGNGVTLSSDCDRRLVAAEVSSERTVEWVVKAPGDAADVDRAPLNLALVVDRSGSMRGDKLRYAQQAACHVLDLLDDRDRVAVVAYDDQVVTVAGSVRAGERERHELKERIGALRSGGQTDLAGGWLRGCQEVADHEQGEAVNRALLLTDGLANRGITDVEELAHHARELRRRGISTSTFGVGLDFNEQLLEALAEEGGGHYFHIQQPDQIPDLFRQELGELLTVVAREVFLSIGVPKGISVEVLGDLPHEREADRIRVFLGDLSANEQRAIYTRVLLPPDMPGTSVVLRAELGYADLDGKSEIVTHEQWFSYARQAEVLLVPIHQELLRRAGHVQVATAAARALKLERRGAYRDARDTLADALNASGPYLAAEAAQDYYALATELEQGLDEGRRKQAHFKAYLTRQSRA